jgi:cytochrome d ubiquinol oxidase subunit I
MPSSKWFMRAAAIAGVLAIVALESGWIVTEVGRQPWIVQGFMRTSEAVTPAKGIWWIFAFTMLLYITLFTTAALILRALSRRWREGEPEEGELPYSPPPAPQEGSA